MVVRTDLRVPEIRLSAFTHCVERLWPEVFQDVSLIRVAFRS